MIGRKVRPVARAEIGEWIVPWPFTGKGAEHCGEEFKEILHGSLHGLSESFIDLKRAPNNGQDLGAVLEKLYSQSVYHPA